MFNVNGALLEYDIDMSIFARLSRSGLLKGGALLLLGLCIGVVIGYFYKGKVGSENIADSIKQSLVPIEEKGTSYAFVHPLLAYRTPEATILGDYVSLKDSLQTIVNSAVNGSQAARVSVYFRDLDAGRWVGIGQDDTYYPASLLKVPTMIAYYKEAEEDPSTFSQNIIYDPGVMPNEPFLAPSELVAGNSYSVESLIKYMVTDSDNGATFTLLSRISPDFLNAVYTALGVQNPGNDSANYQISARTYGLFFRVLYNATYLSPGYSERALKLLSQATFTDGLAAGVPKETTIAHKYGNRILSQNGNVTGVELSDCGIVYYPAHPYLLCVMTSSNNVPTASKIIANISRAAYTAVQQRYATTTAQ